MITAGISVSPMRTNISLVIVCLVTCHLKQVMFMNMAHNKLKSNFEYYSLPDREICLGLPSHIANLTQLQTLNLTNNNLEVRLFG